MRAPIVLLTDFGLRDAYVGAMKGAILARDPEAVLVDLCHEVPPQDLRRAALLLATNVEVFPSGSIFVVVVDPGVGTARRALALEAADWRFVGPDNGVLSWALEALARSGRLEVCLAADRLEPRSGALAVELTEPRYWRARVSSTFHGRDIFGPVAAELSRGRALADLGRPVDSLTRLRWPEPRPQPDGSTRGEVLTTDTYGNLITNFRPEDLPAQPRFELAGWTIEGLAPHFQSSAALVALVGSSGLIEIAAPSASAARLTGAIEGAALLVKSGRH